MLGAGKLAIAGLIAWGCWHPATALVSWSGFEEPARGLCSFGSPLPGRNAALVISGRFEMGLGRANPIYSLVFTANDGSPEITKLAVSIDQHEIARFDVVSHVPAASGASAVVSLDTVALGTLLRATDMGKVVHVVVPPMSLSYDFDLTGFATAADVFSACMLHNAP